MGLDLSGLGNLLRRGIDDVGSVITGQDWHSAPTAQIQQQAPQIQSQPQQLPQFNQSGPRLPSALPQQFNIGQLTGNQANPWQQHVNQVNQYNYQPPQPHASILHDLTHNPVTNFAGGVVKPLLQTGEAVSQGIGNAELALGGRPIQNQQQYSQGLPSDFNKAINQDYQGTAHQIGSNLAQTGLTALTGGIDNLAAKGAAGITGFLAPKASSEAITLARLGLNQAKTPLVSNAIKYGTGALTGGAVNAGFGASGAAYQGATPIQIAKAGAESIPLGVGLGVAAPLVGSGVSKGIKYAQDNTKPLNEVGAVGKNVPKPTSKLVQSSEQVVPTPTQAGIDPLAALKQEALKYKSADEFVNSQPKLFHGTDANLDLNNIEPGHKNEITVNAFGNTTTQKFGNDAGFSLSRDENASKGYGKNLHQFTLSPNAKIATSKDIPEVYKQFDDGKYFNQKDAVAAAKAKGFDGVDLQEMESKTPTPTKNQEIQVFNKDALISKQQLTDLYNQAHAEKGKIAETPLAKSERLHQEKLAKHGLTQNEYADMHDKVSELDARQSELHKKVGEAFDAEPRKADGTFANPTQPNLKKAIDAWGKSLEDHRNTLNALRKVDGQKPIVLGNRSAHAEAKGSQPIKIQPRSQKSGLALSKPDAAAYAQVFNEDPAKAIQIVNSLKQSDVTGPTPKVTPLEADAIKQEGLTPKLSREDILQQGNQQTNHQIDTKVERGNTKGAIVRAEGIVDESKDLFKKADILGKKLDKHDQALISERADPSVEIKPHNPELFNEAANAYNDAYDYHLAAQRAGGADTLRYGNGNYTPLNLKATPKQMDALGVPNENRFNKDGYTGFRDVSRQFRSYTDAKKSAGLEPANKNPLQDHRDYSAMSSTNLRNALLRKTLESSNPGEVAAKGMGAEASGKEFNQAAGGNLPFNTSAELDKQLGNYRKAFTPVSLVGKGIDKTLQLTGQTTKKGLFLGSVFHQAHITENVALGTNPKIAALGLQNEFKAKGGITTESYHKMLDINRQDGTLQYARNMGLKLSDKSALDRYVSSYALGMARFAKEGGIPENSPAAIDLGKINNHLLGRENAQAENINPTLEKYTSYFALAPHYLRTQLQLVKEAVLPKKLGGAGYDKPFNSLTPGGAARSAVLGPRLFGAIAAITASAIIMNKFPTWQDAVNQAGLNPNNTNPNIGTNSKNSKGEHQLLNLPTDPLGLAFGLLTDPKHFFQSRESPALSFGTKLLTNQGYNGQKLSDPNQPHSIAIRAKNAALQSVLPIGVQNFTNTGNNPNNPSVAQGIAQTFGLRVKTDPNDPQAIATQQHYDQQKQLTGLLATGQLSQIDPSLQNVSPQQAHQLVNDYNAKHPSGNTDPTTGLPYPKQYDANSASEKHDAYVDNTGPHGAEALNANFYIDKKLAMQDPSRPHDPLYDLNGTGNSFTLDKDGNIVGTSEAPQAQVALDYAKEADPAQKALMLAANPWLNNYEKAVGNYGSNYQQNINAYQQQQGWSPKAIADYNNKHPNTVAPIAPPTFSPGTQALMDKYESITDPTEKAQFFQDNAKELSGAFTAMGIYKNQHAVAQGNLPQQMHPTPNVNAAYGLTQLQKNPNHDKAISKANALLIQGNPDLAQYLADSGIYTLAKDAARYQFQDPANPGLSAGQLLNLGRPIDQSTLKGIQNVGKYDIGKDANGKFSFLGAGGAGKFADGTASGSGGSGGHGHYKFQKKVKAPHFKRIKLHNPHEHRLRTSKSYRLKTPTSTIPKQSQGSIKIKKVMV